VMRSVGRNAGTVFFNDWISNRQVQLRIKLSDVNFQRPNAFGCGTKVRIGARMEFCPMKVRVENIGRPRTRKTVGNRMTQRERMRVRRIENTGGRLYAATVSANGTGMPIYISCATVVLGRKPADKTSVTSAMTSGCDTCPVTPPFVIIRALTPISRIRVVTVKRQSQ